MIVAGCSQYWIHIYIQSRPKKIEINHEYDRIQIRMDRNREDKNELLTDKWSD